MASEKDADRGGRHRPVCGSGQRAAAAVSYGDDGRGAGALAGVRVVDFTTLLPGPLATLILAEAGAEVIKIEAPGGDPLRANAPWVGGIAVSFALLNRHKTCRTLNLKAAADRVEAERLIAAADVVVEQFRPGVMDRLGLGYEAMRRLKPDLVYCSITGYGQDGPEAQRAGHDLNYLARAGILSLGGDGRGHPAMPPTQIADVGGGALPAALNILAALYRRDRTGEGAHLDIAMAENVVGWAHGSLARTMCGQVEPGPGEGRLYGGSPRYHLYETADGRFLAVAALEERFWQTFCAAIGLSGERVAELGEGPALIAEVAAILRGRTCGGWMEIFAGRDVCVEPVLHIDEALADVHFAARGLFSQQVELVPGHSVSALPVPLAKVLRRC